MKPAVLFAALGLLAGVGAAHAADARLGRSLAATCANCHGTHGQAVADAGIDALAGQPQAILTQKLGAFKRGERPGTIMPQIAKGYSDEQLALIAEFFATQKPGALQ